MNISLQNFSTLVSNSAAAAQGSCSALLDFTAGSVARALIEANSTVALWIQYLILQVLSVTRLATSFGSDVDTWIAQYGVVRLGATAATTSETFISLSPASTSAVVPVGAIVKSSDGTIAFTVTEDSTNQYWSDTAGGYVRPQGLASITCPVQCNTAGAIGNVSGGVINLLGTQIAGIDTCTNLSAVSNGADEESDDSVKNRMVLWFSSLSSATLMAVEASISGVASNLTYQVVENQTPGGQYRGGYFFATIDDGSGDVSDTILNSVEDAIEATRACGVETSTLRATVIPAAIVVPVSLASGVDLMSVQTAVSGAVTNYVNALGVGSVCQYTFISSIALQAAGSLVTSVGVVTVNGVVADIGGTVGSVVRIASVTVNSGGN
ncbi:baseplate J/gp47 family protein [Acetobacter fallax]|uniref:Baseplate protein J-like barrel domain-containing protein n=1 Tax=Acetobacter fallax TaxID=1737473 RepID=A0ABX0K6K1_9PROT|nr:baseplate J/gp47 family protein [Acetobacter fallax]NHO32019.1 hypothetical protein [Acetobacter fallax]NHO35465.1 hypothetical protein [Acetobacter fallax]